MAVGVDDRSRSERKNGAHILPMRSQRNADGMKYKKEALTSALLIAGLLC